MRKEGLVCFFGYLMLLGCMLFSWAGVASAKLASKEAAGSYSTLLQKSDQLPITTFNFTFRVGSADDPKGLSGIAALTAALMREGGVGQLQLLGRQLPARTRAEIEELLFPLAAEIGVSVEKEQTSFRVTTSAADAEKVFDILAQMILAPAFDKKEFERLRSETLDALQKQLPREDQEELGKAVLDQRLYGTRHPYGHVVEGTVSAVKAVTMESLRAFYQTRFRQDRLIVAAAGVVNADLEKKLKTAFEALAPKSKIDPPQIGSVPERSNLRLTLVKGAFDAVGVHFGQPLPVNRASADFPALYLASLAFGKHRSFVGRLMRVVREVRGLNYGAYSYVEDFPDGGHRLTEPTQAARTRQAFTVWGRPTTIENGCFLVRQLYREVKSLAQKGLTKDEFNLTQSHLVGSAPLLATGLERRLGYAIDSKFYGIHGDHLAKLQNSARSLTVFRVNSVLKKYLDPRHLELVVVTPDPDRLKTELLSERCQITYATGVEKAPEVLAEDKEIGTYALGLQPSDITVISADEVFEQE